MRPKSSENTSEGSDIALKYMVYLASHADKLEQFCVLSGMGEQDLKSRLLEPAFHGFLLDFLLQDESELLAFAAEQQLKPEAILRARAKLPGFTNDF